MVLKKQQDQVRDADKVKDEQKKTELPDDELMENELGITKKKLEPNTQIEKVNVLTGKSIYEDPADPNNNEFVIWQSDGTDTGENGDILIKRTFGGTTYTNYLTKCVCLKAHRTTEDTNITTDAWTDCSSFTLVDAETQGGGLSLNSDGKTVDVLKRGYYQFGGCIHIQNNTTGKITSTVLTRLYKNGSNELRCSQRGFTIDINADGEEAISFNGYEDLSVGDSINLQYYVTNPDVEFRTNSNFANQVAYTMWFIRCGD